MRGKERVKASHPFNKRDILSETLYFGSGSWVTRLWEKLNKIHVWINCVRSSKCWIWRFRGSNFQTFFGGEYVFGPPCITNAFGADSRLVSTVIWCLMQLQKNSIQWTKRMMIPSLDETEVWTPKKHYKTKLNSATEKIVKSIGDEKSTWIMNLEENSCRNHESSRQKRRESRISKLKWFCFYLRYLAWWKWNDIDINSVVKRVSRGWHICNRIIPYV